MPIVLQAPFFPQFFIVQATVAGNVIVPAAGYKLRTTLSGTGTAAATYSDQAGTSANTNPITLNSLGMCNLWLTQGIEYRLDLYDPTNTIQQPGWPLDDIAGIPLPTSGSFVPLAGAVTMTGLFQLSGNATSALNPVPLQQLSSTIASTTKTAVTVSIADAGNYYTGTNVEAALQEAAALPGRWLRTTVFTVSGTWTKGAGTAVVEAEVVGSGAGTRNTSVAQGGGGAGGYSRKRITTAGATEAVVIGAAAVATAGATTSFGAHCQGGGGALSNGTSNAIGGLGGIGSGGDLNLQGGGGGFGAVISNPADLHGHGGNSFFGGGAPGLIFGFGTNSVNGAANTGGGGSGINAAGGTGVCIVREYT